MKRPWLAPFSPLYGAVVAWKNRRWESDASRSHALQAPVLSVGSLSAGGAGKTPVVVALVQLLQQHACSVDILSRGYGRVSTALEQVDPHGDATRFGDEPLMLAQRTGVPVFVGADRWQLGMFAESSYRTPTMHILDDGFQHRRLRRQLDAVLLTQEDIADTLLPGGNLREPLASLQRASACVVRAEEMEALLPYAHLYKKPVWSIVRRTRLLQPVQDPMIFCGIARPHSFVEMVAQQQVRPVKEHFFPDHHRYTHNDIAALVQQAHAAQAHGWITTAKDFVKLTPDLRRRLEEIGPISVLDLTVTFQYPDQVWQQIAAQCLDRPDAKIARG